MSQKQSAPNTAEPRVAVPFVDLKAYHRTMEDELIDAFRHAVRGAAFVGGPEVAEFEREFADFCGVDYCVGVNSGTDALRLAYITLGLKPGDEVIAPSHTFIATTEAITQAGGRVKFAEVDEATMTLDPGAVEAAIGPRTVGIAPVHIYGQPADMAAIGRIAAKHDLWIVEDAAQAHGARFNGRRVGGLGSLGCFSFYPGKNLGSLGEGGAVTGGSAELMRSIRLLREHGQSSKYVHELEGYNSRLHAIQAAFLRIKLRRLDEANRARQRAAQWYRAALANVAELRLPSECDGVEHVYHLFVVRTEERDRLGAFLKERQIASGLHYPRPLHLHPAYEYLGVPEGALPITEQVAATCLSLPMFPGLTEGQVAAVSSAVQEFFS